MSLPIFIVCHNNGWMVENTVRSLSGRFDDTRIVIVDEASTAPRTLDTLRRLEARHGVTVHRHRHNIGPKRVRRYPRYFLERRHPFVLTDPDLDLSKLPDDTLDVLGEVSRAMRLRSVGPALDISDRDDLIEGPYVDGRTILEWESRFWQTPADLSALRRDLEAYWAPIDTTFAYYDFSHPRGRAMRLAGPYTVRHLPWHKSYVRDLAQDDFRDYFEGVGETSSTAPSVRRFREQARARRQAG